MNCDKLTKDIDHWKNLKIRCEEEIQNGIDIELNNFFVKNANRTIEKLQKIIDKKNNDEK